MASLFEGPLLKVNLPKSVALKKDFFRAPNATKTLYLIEDAHTNLSAQRNISKTIDLLTEKEKIRLVFLEAGSGNDSLSELRVLGSKEKRTQVANKYLKRGLLQGPDYSDLTSSQDILLWGVENKELYAKSLEVYKGLREDRDGLNAYLDKIDRTIFTLTPKVFNPALLDFIKKRESFSKGDISFVEYFGLLNSEAQKRNLLLDLFPNLLKIKALKDKEAGIDFDKAALEQQEAIKSLPQDAQEELRDFLKEKDVFKLNSQGRETQKAFFAFLEEKLGDKSDYPNLAQYFDYLRIFESLNMEEVLEEQSILEALILNSLAKTKDEAQLLRVKESAATLRQLLNLKLTSQSYQEIEKRSKDFNTIEMFGFLNKKIMDLNSSFEETLFFEPKLEEGIARAMEFYSLARERDSAFIQNAIKKMSENGASKAILVTGGHHTDNLKEILRRQNISFVQITPQVLHETNIKRYEEILLNQASAIPSQLGSQNNLGVLPAREIIYPMLLEELGALSIASDKSGARLTEQGALDAARAYIEAVKIETLRAEKLPTDAAEIAQDLATNRDLLTGHVRELVRAYQVPADDYGNFKVLRFELPFAGNFYAIEYLDDTGEKKYILIDSGSSFLFKDIQELLAGNGIDRTNIDRVLVTHGHIDHFGGAIEWARLGVPVHIHSSIELKREEEWRHPFHEHLAPAFLAYDPEKALDELREQGRIVYFNSESQSFGNRKINSEEMKIVDILTIARDLKIEVLEAPVADPSHSNKDRHLNHSHDQVLFYIQPNEGQKPALFSGDVALKTAPHSSLPDKLIFATWNLWKYWIGIKKKLLSIGMEDKHLNRIIKSAYGLRVYPGHGSAYSTQPRNAEKAVHYVSPVKAGIFVEGTFSPFMQMRSKEGVGMADFDAADKIVKFHALMGMQLAQSLPITVSSANNSPYSVESSKALDPKLIGIKKLLDEFPNDEAREFLIQNKTEIERLNSLPQVDNDAIYRFKMRIFEMVWEKFKNEKNSALYQEFLKFQQENSDWLPDHLLYMQLKKELMGRDPGKGWDWRTWNSWDQGLSDYGYTGTENDAIRRARERHQEVIAFASFIQFVADRQLTQLLYYAREQNVQIVLDIPFALDGADIWLNPKIFGLKPENNYQRLTTMGVPPEGAYPAGQYWQFYPYDWSNPNTPLFILDIFKYNQKRSPYIRLDHVLGYYRTYHFTEDVTEQLTLKTLGLMDVIAQIRSEAIGLGTPEAKKIAAGKVMNALVEKLKEAQGDQTRFGLPQDALENLFDKNGNIDTDNMIMVARSAQALSGEPLAVRDGWSRQFVVEKHVFKGISMWDSMRVTPSKALDDEGFMEQYLFPENESEIPIATDSIRLGYFKLAPAERTMSSFLKQAQERGTVLIWETLGAVPKQIEESTRFLGGTNYIPMIWGFDKDSAFHPSQHTQNAFATIGLHDSTTLRDRWENELSRKDKIKILKSENWFPGLPDGELEHHLSFTREVHQKIFDQLYASKALMVAPNWLDILGLDGSYRLNSPGVQTSQWVNRLPIEASIENLIDAANGVPSTEMAEAAVLLLRNAKTKRAVEILSSDKPQILRVDPEVGGEVLQIRQVGESFLVDAYTLGKINQASLVVRMNETEEVKVPMLSSVETVGLPKDVKRWRADSFSTSKLGKFDFYIEVIDEAGNTYKSSSGKLWSVPENANLNPLSSLYIGKSQGARLAVDTVSGREEKYPGIYLVNTRAYLAGKTFAEITDEDLRQIRLNTGADVFWFMGVWEESPYSEALNKSYDGGAGDRVASAYAIYNYTVNPKLGGEEELRDLVRRAKTLGIRIMVDIVPNHMAADSPLIGRHPEYFMALDPAHTPSVEQESMFELTSSNDRLLRHIFKDSQTGRYFYFGHIGKDHKEMRFGDAVQLDFRNSGMREWLKKAIFKAAEITEGGGLRFDLVWLVFSENFRRNWQLENIAQQRTLEINIQRLRDVIFEKTIQYLEMPTTPDVTEWFAGQRLRDELELEKQESELRNLVNLYAEMSFIEETLAELKRRYPGIVLLGEAYHLDGGPAIEKGFDYYYERYIYELLKRNDISTLKDFFAGNLAGTHPFVLYLENHDHDTRALKELGRERFLAATTLVYTLPGALLVNQGQELGRASRVDGANSILHLKPHEEYDETVAQHYQSLGYIRRISQAFQRGSFKLLKAHLPNSEDDVPNVIAFEREYQGEGFVVVVNYSDQNLSSVRIEGLGEDEKINLAPWGSSILKIKNNEITVLMGARLATESTRQLEALSSRAHSETTMTPQELTYLNRASATVLEDMQRKKILSASFEMVDWSRFDVLKLSKTEWAALVENILNKSSNETVESSEDLKVFHKLVLTIYEVFNNLAHDKDISHHRQLIWYQKALPFIEFAMQFPTTDENLKAHLKHEYAYTLFHVDDFEKCSEVLRELLGGNGRDRRDVVLMGYVDLELVRLARRSMQRAIQNQDFGEARIFIHSAREWASKSKALFKEAVAGYEAQKESGNPTIARAYAGITALKREMTILFSTADESGELSSPQAYALETLKEYAQAAHYAVKALKVTSEPTEHTINISWSTLKDLNNFLQTKLDPHTISPRFIRDTQLFLKEIIESLTIQTDREIVVPRLAQINSLRQEILPRVMAQQAKLEDALKNRSMVVEHVKELAGAGYASIDEFFNFLNEVIVEGAETETRKDLSKAIAVLRKHWNLDLNDLLFIAAFQKAESKDWKGVEVEFKKLIKEDVSGELSEELKNRWESGKYEPFGIEAEMMGFSEAEEVLEDATNGYSLEDALYSKDDMKRFAEVDSGHAQHLRDEFGRLSGWLPRAQRKRVDEKLVEIESGIGKFTSIVDQLIKNPASLGSSEQQQVTRTQLKTIREGEKSAGKRVGGYKAAIHHLETLIRREKEYVKDRIKRRRDEFANWRQTLEDLSKFEVFGWILPILEEARLCETLYQAILKEQESNTHLSRSHFGLAMSTSEDFYEKYDFIKRYESRLRELGASAKKAFSAITWLESENGNIDAALVSEIRERFEILRDHLQNQPYSSIREEDLLGLRNKMNQIGKTAAQAEEFYRRMTLVKKSIDDANGRLKNNKLREKYKKPILEKTALISKVFQELRSSDVSFDVLENLLSRLDTAEMMLENLEKSLDEAVESDRKEGEGWDAKKFKLALFISSLAAIFFITQNPEIAKQLVGFNVLDGGPLRAGVMIFVAFTSAAALSKDSWWIKVLFVVFYFSAVQFRGFVDWGAILTAYIRYAPFHAYSFVYVFLVSYVTSWIADRGDLSFQSLWRHTRLALSWSLIIQLFYEAKYSGYVFKEIAGDSWRALFTLGIGVPAILLPIVISVVAYGRGQNLIELYDNGHSLERQKGWLKRKQKITFGNVLPLLSRTNFVVWYKKLFSPTIATVMLAHPLLIVVSPALAQIYNTDPENIQRWFFPVLWMPWLAYVLTKIPPAPSSGESTDAKPARSADGARLASDHSGQLVYAQKYIDSMGLETLKKQGLPHTPKAIAADILKHQNRLVRYLRAFLKKYEAPIDDYGPYQVLRFELPFAGNVFALRYSSANGESRHILIETSASFIFDDLRVSLASHGITEKNIDYVLVTHGHMDHMGGIFEWAKLGVIIYFHPLIENKISTEWEHPFTKFLLAGFSNYNPSVDYPSLLTRYNIINRRVRFFGKNKAGVSQGTREINGQEFDILEKISVSQAFEIEVLKVPASDESHPDRERRYTHSEDQVLFYIPAKNLIFTGDVAVNESPEKALPWLLKKEPLHFWKYWIGIDKKYAFLSIEDKPTKRALKSSVGLRIHPGHGPTYTTTGPRHPRKRHISQFRFAVKNALVTQLSKKSTWALVKENLKEQIKKFRREWQFAPAYTLVSSLGLEDAQIKSVINYLVDEAPFFGWEAMWAKKWEEAAKSEKIKSYQRLKMLYAALAYLTKEDPDYERISNWIKKIYKASREDDYTSKGLSPPHIEKFEIPFNGHKFIPAYLITPAYIPAGQQVPVIVMLHGLTHRKEQPYLDYFERELVRRGFAILRPDLSGHGENQDFMTTPEQNVASVEAMLLFLKKQSQIDSEQVGMFGFSFGGYTTIRSLLAPEVSENIHAAAVLNPPLIRTFHSILNLLFLRVDLEVLFNIHGFRNFRLLAQKMWSYGFDAKNFTTKIPKIGKLLYVAGDEDGLIHSKDRKTLSRLLRLGGNEGRVIVERGQKHYVLGESLERTVNNVADFFDQQFPRDPELAVKARFLRARDEKEKAKIEESINIIRKLEKPTEVVFVVPMYKEEDRLRPRSHKNQAGEDALDRKVQELEFLRKINPNFQWKLILVDDGSPRASSANLARSLWHEIYEDYKERGVHLDSRQVTILTLTPQEKEQMDSRKGGAVLKGLREALRVNPDASFIGYTDLDRSTDLRQTGLLIKPLMDESAEVAIGSRRMPEAHEKRVSFIGNLSSRGYNIAVHLLLPPLDNIRDTQRGFKLFERKVLEEILDDAMDNGFTFDTELLLLVKMRGYDIAEVAIAWFDSNKAAKFNSFTQSAAALQGVWRQRKTYLKLKKEAANGARLALEERKISIEEYRRYIRKLDSLLLWVTAPPVFFLLLTMSIIIKVEMLRSGSDEPILFKQPRVGRNDQIFKIFKFRTYLNGKTTRVTRALRKVGLDELPQWFNIYQGHMSFWGIRPLPLDVLFTHPRFKDHYYDAVNVLNTGIFSLGVAMRGTSRGVENATRGYRLQQIGHDRLEILKLSYAWPWIVLLLTSRMLGITLAKQILGKKSSNGTSSGARLSAEYRDRTRLDVARKELLDEYGDLVDFLSATRSNVSFRNLSEEAAFVPDVILTLGSANVEQYVRLARYWKGLSVSERDKPIIVVSGGIGRQTPDLIRNAKQFAQGKNPLKSFLGSLIKTMGKDLTEADVIRLILINQGVPDGKILLERTSSNTLENIRNSSLAIQKDQRIQKPVKLIVFTEPHHVLRTYLTTKRDSFFASGKFVVQSLQSLGIAAKAISDEELIRKLTHVIGYPKSLGGSGVGSISEIERIEEYGQKKADIQGKPDIEPFSFRGVAWNPRRVKRLREWLFAGFIKAEQRYRSSVSGARLAIEQALRNKPFDAEALLSALEEVPALSEHIRVDWNRRHTRQVLQQFTRYFHESRLPVLPGGFSRESFLLLLALHDIGKPYAFSTLRREHDATLEFIVKAKDDLPITAAEMKIFERLISGRTLGLFMRRELSLESALERLNSEARRTGLDAKDYLHLKTIYLQVDTSSYTEDTEYRKYDNLNFLYPILPYIGDAKIIPFDSSRKRLIFRGNMENRFRELESAVKNQGARLATKAQQAKDVTGITKEEIAKLSKLPSKKLYRLWDRFSVYEGDPASSDSNAVFRDLMIKDVFYVIDYEYKPPLGNGSPDTRYPSGIKHVKIYTNDPSNGIGTVEFLNIVRAKLILMDVLQRVLEANRYGNFYSESTIQRMMNSSEYIYWIAHLVSVQHAKYYGFDERVALVLGMQVVAIGNTAEVAQLQELLRPYPYFAQENQALRHLFYQNLSGDGLGVIKGALVVLLTAGQEGRLDIAWEEWGVDLKAAGRTILTELAGIIIKAQKNPKADLAWVLSKEPGEAWNLPHPITFLASEGDGVTRKEEIVQVPGKNVSVDILTQVLQGLPRKISGKIDRGRLEALAALNIKTLNEKDTRKSVEKILSGTGLNPAEKQSAVEAFLRELRKLAMESQTSPDQPAQIEEVASISPKEEVSDEAVKPQDISAEVENILQQHIFSDDLRKNTLKLLKDLKFKMLSILPHRSRAEWSEFSKNGKMHTLVQIKPKFNTKNGSEYPSEIKSVSVEYGKTIQSDFYFDSLEVVLQIEVLRNLVDANKQGNLLTVQAIEELLQSGYIRWLASLLALKRADQYGLKKRERYRFLLRHIRWGSHLFDNFERKTKMMELLGAKSFLWKEFELYASTFSKHISGDKNNIGPMSIATDGDNQLAYLHWANHLSEEDTSSGTHDKLYKFFEFMIKREIESLGESISLLSGFNPSESLPMPAIATSDPIVIDAEGYLGVFEAARRESVSFYEISGAVEAIENLRLFSSRLRFWLFPEIVSQEKSASLGESDFREQLLAIKSRMNKSWIAERALALQNMATHDPDKLSTTARLLSLNREYQGAIDSVMPDLKSPDYHESRLAALYILKYGDRDLKEEIRLNGESEEGLRDLEQRRRFIVNLVQKELEDRLFQRKGDAAGIADALVSFMEKKIDGEQTAEQFVRDYGLHLIPIAEALIKTLNEPFSDLNDAQYHAFVALNRFVNMDASFDLMGNPAMLAVRERAKLILSQKRQALEKSLDYETDVLNRVRIAALIASTDQADEKIMDILFSVTNEELLSREPKYIQINEYRSYALLALIRDKKVWERARQIVLQTEVDNFASAAKIVYFSYLLSTSSNKLNFSKPLKDLTPEILEKQLIAAGVDVSAAKKAAANAPYKSVEDFEKIKILGIGTGLKPLLSRRLLEFDVLSRIKLSLVSALNHGTPVLRSMAITASLDLTRKVTAPDIAGARLAEHPDSAVKNSEPIRVYLNRVWAALGREVLGKSLPLAFAEEQKEATHLFSFKEEEGTIVAYTDSIEIPLSNQKEAKAALKKGNEPTLTIQDLRLMDETLDNKIKSLLGDLKDQDTPVLNIIDLSFIPEDSFSFYLDYLLDAIAIKKTEHPNALFKLEGTDIQLKEALSKASDLLLTEAPKDIKTVYLSSGNPKEGYFNLPINKLSEGDIPAFRAILELAIHTGSLDITHIDTNYLNAYSTLSKETPDTLTLGSILQGKATKDILLKYSLKAITRVPINQAIQFFRNMKRMLEMAA